MRKRELGFIVITVLVLSCLTLAGPGNNAAKPDDLYPYYQTFSHLVSRVSDYYVEPVDPKELFYGAYDGLMQSLDPYSAFLPPAEKEDLEAETKGEFGGLGIEVTLDKTGVLTVIAPLEGSPAFKAGILAGDRIIRIETKSTKGLTLREAVDMLRGPKGKAVSITVLHESGKIEEIKVVRDIIKLESVRDAGIVDEKQKIGYIRLTQFQANSVESLDKAVEELEKQGMKALVLDLRFNPGGLLTSAIDISDRFLADGIIVSTKGRKSPERVYKAQKDGAYPEFPLAVLISNRSASAAEIIAGAIQDNKRGLIVGTRSFGKGSVQTLLKLEDGKSAIRLTTAYYYTPSGRLIHRNPNDPDQKTWGIDPDIEVKVTPEDELALWNHWRTTHEQEMREKSKPPAGETPKETPPKPEAPEPAPVPSPDDEFGPLPNPAQPDPTAPPKEFHDKTLEAAINALKGMILAEDRMTVEAAK